MSSNDFEVFCLSILKEYSSDLPNSNFEHNVIIKSSDGEYQIDGQISFELMGAKYLTLVECKRYKRFVSREKVQVLYDKIRTIGANKGILMTTSGYQRGALKFAKEHGITLITVVDGKMTYEVRTIEAEDIYYPDILPKYAGIVES